MRAVVLPKTGPKELLKLTRIVRPTPNQGEALVRIHYNSVCYRDLIDRSGGFPFINLPAVIGHEISGVVELSRSPALNVGDRVVSLHWAPCDECAPCQRGEPTVCERRAESFLGLTAHGGYAELAAIRANGLLKIPDAFSLRDAASVMCTYGTCYHTLFQRARLLERVARGAPLRVLVTGASGGVGSAALQMLGALKSRGVTVVALTSSARKAAHLHALGADEVLVAASAADVAAMAAHQPLKLATAPCDFAFDCVGAPTFMTCVRALKPGGTLAFIGNVDVGKIALPLGLCVINELSLVAGDSIGPRELSQCFDFLVEHGIRPHIHAVLPLSAAVDAHAMLERREVCGRILLDCTQADQQPHASL